jgi:hypothetical protein
LTYDFLSSISGSKQQWLQPNKTLKSPKVTSSTPAISLHTPSSTTITTARKLPAFQSKTDRSISDTQSNTISVSSTNSIIPPTLPFHQAGTSEPNSQVYKKDLPVVAKSPEFESIWDLNELSRFFREIFKQHSMSTGD